MTDLCCAVLFLIFEFRIGAFLFYFYEFFPGTSTNSKRKLVVGSYSNGHSKEKLTHFTFCHLTVKSTVFVGVLGTLKGHWVWWCNLTDASNCNLSNFEAVKGNFKLSAGNIA